VKIATILLNPTPHHSLIRVSNIQPAVESSDLVTDTFHPMVVLLHCVWMVEGRPSIPSAQLYPVIMSSFPPRVEAMSICLSPPKPMLKFDCHCHSFRSWDLWVVISHEDSALMNTWMLLSWEWAHYKRSSSTSFSPSAMGRHDEKTLVTCWHIDVGVLILQKSDPINFYSL
jgi:hypothetical protein